MTENPGHAAENKKRYVVRTLGCKANFYDSQLIEAELQRQGWVPTGDGAPAPDLCVINSCTVTDEADRQTRKLAARLSRENPSARVVVTGCAAEVDPERLSKSQGIDYVIGNRDKPDLVSTILRRIESANPSETGKGSGEVLGSALPYLEMASRHPHDREWPLPRRAFELPPALLEGHNGKTRAFLKIQEGCNSFCTYCVIPYGRGPSRSLRQEEAVERIQKLVDSGVREVVLTGTNLGDFGSDWGEENGLAALARAVLSRTGVERLRLSSLDPVEITPGLLDLMASEPRLCPHFHVSLQSAHPRILKLMKRKYGHDDIVRCLESIAKIPAPAGGVFVGMDVITGFPGETEAEFQWGMKALEALPWTRLHVFPYSERAGTPATRLPGAVPQHERTRRSRELNRLSLDRMIRWHERALQQAQVEKGRLEGILLEKPDIRAGTISGYTPNYLRVIGALPSQAQLLRNQRVRAYPEALPGGLKIDRAAGDVALAVRFEPEV